MSRADARSSMRAASPPTPSIDREGFELIEAPTSVEDFWNEDAIARRLLSGDRRAAEARDRRARGPYLRPYAAPAHAFRPAELSALGRGLAARARRPRPCRSDARLRARDACARFSARRRSAFRARRFAIVNVWRPLFGPVEDAPLAVCDARSVAAARSHRLRSRLSRPAWAKPTRSPIRREQRWFYYPRMRRGEVLLLKCYDSREDVARFSPHTAFDDPATPQDARPRESIELRCFVAFDD